MLESDSLFYKRRGLQLHSSLAERQEEEEAILDEDEETQAVFLTNLMAACELPWKIKVLMRYQPQSKAIPSCQLFYQPSQSHSFTMLIAGVREVELS